jgi:hypothetical protein
MHVFQDINTKKYISYNRIYPLAININQQWLAGEAPIYFDGFAQSPLISGISELAMFDDTGG